jgi:hypothetical protein
MDRILFGDNQFFGVNHMSEEKARAQSMRFKDTRSMVDVLDVAYGLGLRTFMCTTHEQIGEIADVVAADPDRYEDFVFYPGMPYAHKYANAVTELGVVETIKQYAPGGLMETLVMGARSALRKDTEQLMNMLVDAEMKRFSRVKTPVVFLQNVVTDLLLGLGMHDLFRAFHDYVGEHYNAEAGFFTMNMPRAVKALHAVGVANPIICCNYNKIGFRMSGGIEAYDNALANEEFRCVAMSVLASGAIPPEEAIQWICERPRIESIVFGASSRGNISQTIELINKYSRLS